MTDWYVSSAAYAGYTAFQISHAYSIGDIIVPTAPALKAKWVLRCTTAGTSAGTEPTWSTNNNGSTTSGSAVFMNVTGQSAFFWGAVAGDIPTLFGAVGTNRVAAGDRVFVSSDHAETQTTTTFYGSFSGLTPGYGVIQTLCVNRAGSTPPVATDLTTGAICTVTGASFHLEITNQVETYHYGMTYVLNGTGSGQFRLIDFGAKGCYLKNCIIQNLSNVTGVFQINTGSSGGGGVVVFDNTTIQFGHISQCITVINGSRLHWINTPSAIAGAIIPTVLFDTSGNSGTSPYIVLRGVDLSALTTTILLGRNTLSVVQLESCKIASGVTRYTSTGTTTGPSEEIQLINCYDGTHTIAERYQPMGSVTTEFTITLLGGAADDVGGYSHKMISSANVNKFVSPLRGFWLDMNYGAIGLAKTATVEIISSTTLQTDEIALYLEYEGTTGSSVTSFADSLVTSVLSTPANVTSSTQTWNSSPATPITQRLQVTFTPQVAGRIRGQVRLGKASTTVYYNPQMSVR